MNNPTRRTVQTVTGPISPDDLGRTLAHEHLLIGFPGWEADTIRRGPSRAEALARCIDRVSEMKAYGVRSMIDPCPNDLGRDVSLMAEVAARTGFQIICATGLYKEDEGGASYWKFRARFRPPAASIAELFIHELTRGIGDTDIRAGIIKVATGAHGVSAYERTVLEAAAIASRETGAPITTHTDDGRFGDEQQQILTDAGVPAHRIIIGHSCGTSDHAYHMRILERGSYLGFDRFGVLVVQDDEVRVKSLLALLAAGKESQLVVSHDSVWCWRGEPMPDTHDPGVAAMFSIWTPTHFFERIIPKLKAGGATDVQITRLLEENPRRFFAE